ncbi:MAG: sigma-70 family RNA polymerase sigma factor [Bacteroidetes bacterium]|nr:sigma-70 family RNA polymerase sigma factor [Bacteroidota bacterium]
MAFPNPTELLNRIATQDDREAFRLLVEGYSAQLYSYALVFIKNKELAEEIVSDIWIKVWKLRAQLPGIESLSGYLYTAVRNQAHTYRTRIDNNPTLGGDHSSGSDLFAPSENMTPQNSLELSELTDLLDKEISSLPDACQEAFRLVKEDGKSYQEAASEMGISVNTLKTHLRRAMKKLRTSLLNKFSDAISTNS